MGGGGDGIRELLTVCGSGPALLPLFIGGGDGIRDFLTGGCKGTGNGPRVVLMLIRGGDGIRELLYVVPHRSRGGGGDGSRALLTLSRSGSPCLAPEGVLVNLSLSLSSMCVARDLRLSSSEW